MTAEYYDYSLFLKFFDAYAQAGIEGIDENDPLMIEIDHMMEMNNQLFYLADAILLDIQFMSKRVYNMFGIEPEKVSFGYFITTTHPDDVNRHRLLRTKLFNTAQEFYFNKTGNLIVSSNFRANKPEGGYFDLLYQAFMFYSTVPFESVFYFLVITDISRFKNIHKGFHVYVGNDLKTFRYPDDELLMTGNIFSYTEFKIIELIEEGLNSKEIAQRLFRSVYTINTHRTNIIRKSGKSSITEVIRDLKAKGLL